MRYFVDACVRDDSRTLLLAREVLTQLGGADREVCLRSLALPPADYKCIMRRNALAEAGRLDDPLCRWAAEFAAADEIVIAAPYWNLAFPALLHTYLEHVCAVGITFAYDEQNRAYGLCRAHTLHYVTTAGGNIGGEENQLGYRYLQALCREFFGIPHTVLHQRQGLDIG